MLCKYMLYDGTLQRAVGIADRLDLLLLFDSGQKYAVALTYFHQLAGKYHQIERIWKVNAMLTQSCLTMHLSPNHC